MAKERQDKKTTSRSDGRVPVSAPLAIARQGYFYVGGKYDSSAERMFGQMYVQFQIPAPEDQDRIPVIMVHGGRQQSTCFAGTPDGRPGWADYFLQHGWPVYLVDQPGRGRSPYDDEEYGDRNPPDIKFLEDTFTATAGTGQWPQAKLHTQWPGTGRRGDPAFDQFLASQFDGMADRVRQETYTTAALVALLDRIGPAALVTHSQSGPHGWRVADARPDLVKAVIAVEPHGPAFYDETNTFIEQPWGICRGPLTFDPPATESSQIEIEQQAEADAPGLFRCWRQTEPPRQLPNLAGIPILIASGEASFRAQFDHCTSQFLTQAGVENEHLRLETVGIHGNGHMMMLEKNNGEIAEVLITWLGKKLLGQGRD